MKILALSTMYAVFKAKGMVNIAQEEYIEYKERKSKASQHYDKGLALANVAQLFGCSPVHHRVAQVVVSISSRVCAGGS